MSNRLDLGYAVEWLEVAAGADREPLLTPDLRVDGRALLVGCTLDLRALVASTHRSGGFWIFTCGCGEPGCARIEHPVKVIHHPRRVEWQVPWPIRGGSDRHNRRLVFSRTGYFDAVRSALASAKQVAAGLGNDCIGPYGFDGDDLRGLELGSFP